MLDSIVDSFFPVLNSIGKELDEVDSFILENKLGVDEPQASVIDMQVEAPSDSPIEEKASSTIADLDREVKLEEDTKSISMQKPQIRFSTRAAYHLMGWQLLRRFKRFLQRWFVETHSHSKAEPTPRISSSASRILVRIAATRRIVTSLGRLLATKGEVIAQIQKRLLTADISSAGLGIGSGVRGNGELAIHMGDVQGE